MIFIAYNLLNYKYFSKSNLDFKKFAIYEVEKNFPKEKYLLPYSQYSREGLANELKTTTDKIYGQFTKDLPLMMSNCNKLVFFPTKNNYIGHGVYLELVEAKKNNLNRYCFNYKTDSFTLNYELVHSDTIHDLYLDAVFYKKINFLD